MKRIFYTFEKGLLYRKQIRQRIKTNSVNSISFLIDRIEQIKPKIVIFDFDGVLAPHGQEEPEYAAVKCLDHLIASHKYKIYVLSNKPTEERRKYFKNRFKEIKFYICKKKKPFPDSLLDIGKIEKVDIKNMLVIDDRLLTGVLSATISGTEFLFFSKPRIDYSKSFFAEIFFSFMRKIDKLIIYIP